MNLPLPYQDKRNLAQDVLTRAVGQGRLDLGSYSDLVGEVWATDDPAVLDRIIQSMEVAPTAHPHAQPQPPRIPPQHRHIAILGEHSVKGEVLLPQELTAASILGEVRLDFRKAKVSQSVTVINVVNILGAMKLVVPRGVAVHSQVISVLASESLRNEQPQDSDAPSIVLRGINICGEVSIKAQ
ncbi:LiaF domain-containing protein [Corynebacterium sp.]|uniref:LiaF domain-containing protein n=1 Tax=Corynebacterium sp. TaxID=1720 RepID=UPI0026DC6372|nr:LiaF domain-containing protein [Corynebacterium sp.]MDO5076018.1 LiaF-related protein [Corynebacterium sp.]